MAQSLEMCTGFAEAKATHGDIPDPKFVADQVIERHAAGYDVTATRTRVQLDPKVALQGLDGLDFDQRHFAVRPGFLGVRPRLGEVTVSLQPFAGDRAYFLYRYHRPGACFCEMD
jgi:hypothetical protein